MVKSFDVFDTVLTRDVYQPGDIFFLLGLRLEKKGIIRDALNFQKMRITAERLARKMGNKEEVSIIEIYAKLQELMNIQTDVALKIMEEELKIEYEFVSSIQENLKKIDNNTVLVSDTYFNSDFVRKLLKKVGAPNYLEVYTSSEVLKTKNSGKMFEFLGQKYRILEHTGDNYISDFHKASLYGIRGIFYKNSKPTIYEKSIYELENIPYEVRSILSGCMKASRLSRHYSEETLNYLHRVSTNIIGPIMYFYVYWVLQMAKLNNLDVLYFISRDGQLLYKIAKELIENRKINIEIKYLYGSRKSWHLPSTLEFDELLLNWLFDPTIFLSLEEVLKRAELSLSDISHNRELMQFDVKKNLNFEERKVIKEVFQKDEVIRNKIIEKANCKRKIAIEYLIQEGFEKNKKIGIVDVGWRGRQQVSLSKILDAGGIYPETGIYGFYISLVNPVKPYKEDKFFEFLKHEHYPDIIYGYLEIYETFLRATHGSCIDYEKNTCSGSVMPVCRDISRQDLLINEVIQEGAISFVDKFDKHIFEELINIHEQMGREIFSHLMDKFSYPEKEDALAFKYIKVFEDQEESVPYNLVDKIGLRELWIILRKGRIPDRYMWIEGSIALSFDRLSILILKLFHLRKRVARVIKELLKKLVKMR